LQPYAEWTPEINKPDLFMADQLLGTPLEDALVPQAYSNGSPGLGAGTHGSTFAALHAVAAAILVWSTQPDLSPRGVRKLLQAASRPVMGRKDPAPRRLDLADALAEARRRVVKRTLGSGPCSPHALAAITGLDLRVVSATVEDLVGQGKVRRLPRGRLERFELAQV
jgi:DNA-binding transcriptional ArsR family regulator